MFLDRAFAYLHVPGTFLFVGEIVLVVAAFYLMRAWPHSASSLSSAFLVVFLAVSLIRTIPLVPEYGIDAIRDGAIWYYGIFAFAVLSLALRLGPARVAQWFAKLLPLFFIWAPMSLILSNLVARPFVPDSTVSIFSHRPANTSVLLVFGVVYYWVASEPKSRREMTRRALLTALAGLFIVLSGIQNRGGMVASAVGLTVGALLARGKPKRGFGAVLLAAITLSFALFWLLDVRIAVFANDRVISAEQLVANLVSVFQPSAQSLPTDLETTSSWRLDLWTAIFEDVSETAPSFGLGYGVNVAKRYGFEGREEDNFRSAHNSHVSVFAHSGWIGFGLWVLLWWTWFRELSRSRLRYLARGQPFLADLAAVLMAGIAAQLTNAVFDPTIESPQVAAWVWSLYGFGLALIAMTRARWANSSFLPVTDMRSPSPEKIKENSLGPLLSRRKP